MKGIRTIWTEMVYRGPTPEIGDLWCHRSEPGIIASVWEPDEEERKMLAEGGRVVLHLFTEPIPPIMMKVMSDEDTKPYGKTNFKVIPELEERNEQNP